MKSITITALLVSNLFTGIILYMASEGRVLLPANLVVSVQDKDYVTTLAKGL